MKELTVTVSGSAGTGKTTVATLIQRYLKTLGMDARLTLTDRELPPCPRDLQKRTAGVIDNNTTISVVEKMTNTTPSKD